MNHAYYVYSLTWTPVSKRRDADFQEFNPVFTPKHRLAAQRLDLAVEEARAMGLKAAVVGREELVAAA